jgi:hypothetical protein
MSLRLNFHQAFLLWTYISVAGCADREALTLCEAIQLLDGNWDSRSMQSIFKDVIVDGAGAEHIVLAKQPPWRSANLGPLEWMEPYDTFELQMRLQQRSGRSVSTETAQGVAWLLAQREAFGTGIRLIARDCGAPTYFKFE